MERDSRLRVLIHTSYAPRKDVPGGVGSFVQELVPRLEEKGFEIRVLGASLKEKNNSFADHKLGRKVPKVLKKVFSANGTDFEPGLSLNKLRARRILETFRPHLIVAHEPAVPNSAHTLISGIPRREDGKRFVPVIGQFHARKEGIDTRTQAYLRGLDFIRRPRFRFGLPVGMTKGYKATIEEGLFGRIAISRATAKFWNEFFPAQYDVIYNGIDTQIFTPEGPKFKHWQDGKRTIFTTGRHDSRKGLEYLIASYRILRKHDVNLKLMLAGNGKLTPDLKRMVKEQGIPDVHFLGYLTKEDLAKAYRSADLFVAPSSGGEGFNRTIAEARASGTLVVCTAVEGQDEAIGTELTEFMAKPGDSYSLYQKMETVLGLSEEKNREISAKSRQEVVGNFSWEKIAKEHAGYYESVVGQYGIPVWSDYVLKEKTFLSRIPLFGNVFVRDELNKKK